MFKIIDGKEVSAFIKNQAKTEVQKLNEMGISSCLAVIIVGDNPASRVYVNNKKKACEVVGIKSIEYALPESTTESELLSLIDKLNTSLIFFTHFSHYSLPPNHSSTVTPIERAVPATMLIAASIEAALRSGILVSAILRT